MKRILICLVLLLLLSYERLWAEDSEAECAGLTLATTLTWAACNWDNEYEEKAREAIKKAALDKVQALALNTLLSEIPGGSILGAFLGKGGPSGPSEIQLALDKILDAMQVTEERLRELAINIDKEGNIADLNGFKENVKGHQGKEEVFLQAQRDYLRIYYESLNGVLEHLKIYTKPAIGQTIADNIETYHLFLATTALNVQLRSEYLAREYSALNLSEAALARDLSADLKRFMEDNIFLHIDRIDWRAGALSPITDFSKKENTINEIFGHESKVSFKFNGESNSILVKCPWGYDPSTNQSYPATHCTLTYSGKALTQNLYVLSGEQAKVTFSDFNNRYKSEWDVEAIYNQFMDNYEYSMLRDAYSSTQVILDSWYKLIDETGTRPLNYADRRLLEFEEKKNIDDGMLAETSKNISTPYSNWAGESGRIHKLDIDGNGETDLLIGPGNTGKWYLMTSEKGVFRDRGEVLTGYADWQHELARIHTMDVNADGNDDLVIGPGSTGNWYVHLSNGKDGFSTENNGKWATAYGKFWEHSDRIWEIDYNEDGKKDILIGPGYKGDWYLLESTGTSFINRGSIYKGFSSWYKHSNRMRLADLDGDGYDEILIGPSSKGAWYTIGFSGSRLVKKTVSSGNLYGSWWKHSERIHVADLDGNNKDDILIGPGNTGNWYVLLSSSSGALYKSGTTWANQLGEWWNRSSQIRIMDIDSDNKDDVLIGPDVTGEWHALKSNGRSLDYAKYLNQSYGNYFDNPDRIFVIDHKDENNNIHKGILIGPDGATGSFGLITTQ